VSQMADSFYLPCLMTWRPCREPGRWISMQPVVRQPAATSEFQGRLCHLTCPAHTFCTCAHTHTHIHHHQAHINQFITASAHFKSQLESLHFSSHCLLELQLPRDQELDLWPSNTTQIASIWTNMPIIQSKCHLPQKTVCTHVQDPLR